MLLGKNRQRSLEAGREIIMSSQALHSPSDPRIHLPIPEPWMLLIWENWGGRNHKSVDASIAKKLVGLSAWEPSQLSLTSRAWRTVWWLEPKDQPLNSLTAPQRLASEVCFAGHKSTYGFPSTCH